MSVSQEDKQPSSFDKSKENVWTQTTPVAWKGLLNSKKGDYC